jgi:glutathione peroxidase
MSRLWMLLLACACSTPPVPSQPAQAAEQAEPAPAAKGPSLYDLDLTSLDGTDFDTSTLQGKAVLFVNVASKCGYTPQYAGLQSLYEAHADKGLVIVGSPCNQFMGQEPGDAEQIASFCQMNYGVTFPLLAKQDVNGKDRSALYQWLIGSDVGAGAKVKWNFEKFVVDREGHVVARFDSRTTPEDPALLAAVEKALASK